MFARNKRFVEKHTRENKGEREWERTTEKHFGRKGCTGSDFEAKGSKRQKEFKMDEREDSLYSFLVHRLC